MASKVRRCCLQLVFTCLQGVVCLCHPERPDTIQMSERLMLPLVADAFLAFLAITTVILPPSSEAILGVLNGFLSSVNSEFLSDMAEAEHLGVIFLVKIFLSEHLY